MFSDITYMMLMHAGWNYGRTTNPNRWIEQLTTAGYATFPALTAVLMQLGGLEIDTAPFHQHTFSLTTGSQAILEDFRSSIRITFLPEHAEAFNQALIWRSLAYVQTYQLDIVPFGSLHYPHKSICSLCMLSDGRIFRGEWIGRSRFSTEEPFPVLAFLGNTVEDALNTIFQDYILYIIR